MIIILCRIDSSDVDALLLDNLTNKVCLERLGLGFEPMTPDPHPDAMAFTPRQYFFKILQKRAFVNLDSKSIRKFSVIKIKQKRTVKGNFE